MLVHYSSQFLPLAGGWVPIYTFNDKIGAGSSESGEIFRKHSIRFDEAATDFKDPFALNFNDEEHSEDENCEIIIGMSALRRMLLVCYVEGFEDTIRIISARSATRTETKDYEENIRNRNRKVKETASEHRFDCR